MTLIAPCLFMYVSNVLLLHLMASGNLSEYLFSVLLIMTCLVSISIFYCRYPCHGPAVYWDKDLDFSPSLLNNRGQQNLPNLVLSSTFLNVSLAWTCYVDYTSPALFRVHAFLCDLYNNPWILPHSCTTMRPKETMA